MLRDTRRVVAVDSEGLEILINDNMKEIQGELREGRVLHVHQSHYAFLHNRSLLESGGVFVTRATELVSMNPKFRVHEPSSTRRWRTGSRPMPALSTSEAYVGAALPAGNATSWNRYSMTPDTSPYVGGLTPAWNPNSSTPVGSPRARSETPVFLRSRLRECPVSAGEETPVRTPEQMSWDHTQTMDIDPLNDVSDPYGKFNFSIFLIHSVKHFGL